MSITIYVLRARQEGEYRGTTCHSTAANLSLLPYVSGIFTKNDTKIVVIDIVRVLPNRGTYVRKTLCYKITGANIAVDFSHEFINSHIQYMLPLVSGKFCQSTRNYWSQCGSRVFT